MDDNADYKAVCIFCARTDNEVQFNREHVIPESIGGTLYLDKAVCSDCNSRLGAHIDVEIARLPDIMWAFGALNIPHDREGIINRHYNISGKAGDIELRFGKMRGQGFVFPEQCLSDGSLITPEGGYFNSLKRDAKRDKRIREAGLSEQEVEIRLENLRRLYEQTKPGEKVEFPGLGVTLLKRLDRLSINITPRKQANIYPLIAKIAYEIMFFYGGPEFFSLDNLRLRQQLLTSIDQKDIQEGLFVMRVKPHIEEFQPVHLIRLEFPDYATILRVAFFGHIEYVLTAKPLSRALVDNLKEKVGVDDLYALDYQQEPYKSTKSFWTVRENSEVSCIAAM